MKQLQDVLNVTLLQSSICWEDIEANLRQFGKKIEQIKEDTDLVLLPEMFTSGFSMKAEKVHSRMDGEAVEWMRDTAAMRQILLVGSMIMKDNDRYVNRMICAYPDGRLEWYDKKHLFRMGEEHSVYSPGNERKIIEYKGWKILLQVCYDLRFPVFSRNRFEEYEQTYDLALYVANWPAVRHYPWKQLLIARAIENQCYVAAVNRTGDDGKGVSHRGDSALIDYEGRYMTEIIYDEVHATVALDRSALLDYRKKFPAWMDANSFSLGA